VEAIGEVLVTRLAGPGGGRPVYVRDVATVSDTFQEIRSEQWVDGAPGIVLRVSKQAGANTVEVVALLRRELDRINQEYQGRLRVIVVQDAAAYIKASITNVARLGAAGRGPGGAGAAAVPARPARHPDDRRVHPLLDDGDLRADVLRRLLAQPHLLRGLALGVGMLVDNSIVILEKITGAARGPARAAGVGGGRAPGHRGHRGRHPDHRRRLRPGGVPGGFAGVFFAELAMVVVFSLACSLLVAVTLVPTLSARLLDRERPSGPDGPDGPDGGARPWSRLARRLAGWQAAAEDLYGRALRATLRRGWLVVAGACVLLLGAARLSSLVQVELCRRPTRAWWTWTSSCRWARRWRRPGSTCTRSSGACAGVPARGDRQRGQLGGPGQPLPPGGGHEGEVELTLVPVSRRTRGSAEILAAMRQATAGLPDVRIRLRQRTTNPLQRFMRGSRGERLVVELRGHDLEDAARLSRRIEALMRQVPGIADVRIGREEGLEERAVTVSTARAADLGLTRAQVAQTLETYLLGRVATRFRQAGDEYDVRVVLREADRERTEQLASLPVLTARGVVRCPRGRGGGAARPGLVERSGQSGWSPSSAAWRAGAARGGGGPAGGAGRPGAARGVQRGDRRGDREQEATFGGWAWASPWPSCCVRGDGGAVRVAARPLLVMSAVPFGFVGVVATLVLTGTPISLNAFLGCIVLWASRSTTPCSWWTRPTRCGTSGASTRPRRWSPRPRAPAADPDDHADHGPGDAAHRPGPREGAEIQARWRGSSSRVGVSTVVTLVLLPALYVLTARRAPRAAAEAGPGLEASG
jgi:HAE1 family hydrophobic/amphiphilic exporter-1